MGEVRRAENQSPSSFRHLRHTQPLTSHEMTTENASSLAISRLEAFVKEYMKAYDPSHDWAHGMSPPLSVLTEVNRVRNTALKLAATLPGVDMLVVELAALMHDLNDGEFLPHSNP